MPRPEHAIVQILDGGQHAIGLGFAVGSRQVVTCAHVVNTALGRDQREVAPPPARPVWLRFPFSGDEVVRLARVAAWAPRPDEDFELADVCGLVLPEPMPEPVTPLTFADEGSAPTDVQMWGPSPLRETGGHVTGELMGAVDAVRLQVDQRVGGVFSARAGFSGGPVWIRATGQVAGMLQAVGREDVYVIRPEVLVRSWPDVLFRPPPSPYVGLRAFGADDRVVFFGREEFVGALAADAERLPLVVVMGPSGSGKSSVVDAGLVPRLTAGGGTGVVRMRPGRHPVRALAWALWPSEDPDEGAARLRTLGLRRCVGDHRRQAGLARCLVVVDQGEELVTRASEEGFLDLLAELAEPEPRPGLVVAMSIRADYFGPLIVAHERVGDYVRRHARTLRQMSEPELRAAITRPLLRTGPPRVTIRPSLVDRLCADFRGRPGELPLLQFALTRLWEAQRDGELTLESYQTIGGTGALALYADERIALLSDAELAAARRVLTGLVLPGTEDVGRPVARGELRAGDWPVVERLEHDRLVAVNRQGAEPTVEIAHEALLRGWDRLREWLLDDHEFREWRHSTALLQAAWQENGRDPSLLLRGPVLARAEEMVSSHPDDTRRVRPFVEESRRAQDAEERRRRELTARAEALHLSARAELAVATSDLGMEEALLLDICSLRRFPTVEAERALHRRVAASTVLLSRFKGLDDYVSALTFHPRANILAAGGADGTARVWDLSMGRELHRFTGKGRGRGMPEVRRLAFDAAGARLAVGFTMGHDTEVRDLATGGLLHRLPHFGEVTALAFQPGGDLLAVGSEHVVALWDLSGARARKVREIPHRVHAVAFSPDGTLLATGGLDRTAQVWDVATGDMRHRLEHENSVTDVAFHPGGDRLATTSADTHGRPDCVSRVWDLNTGEELHRLAFDASVSFSMAFDPDGVGVATASTDRTARVWELSTGEELHRLVHDSPVYAVAFDPEGQRLASGDDEGTISLWDLAARPETFVAVEDRWVSDVAFHPGGARLAAAAQTSVPVWDLATAAEVRRIAGEGMAVAFDPTGTRLAVGTRAASVWDLETGRETHRFPHDSIVLGVAFHPGGGWLASCSSDGTTRVWDLGTGQEVVRLVHGDESWVRDDDGTPETTVTSLAFDGRGARLATGTSHNVVRVWQVPEGREIRRFIHPRGVQDVAFHPGGGSLATACKDGVVRVWDLETGTEAYRLVVGVDPYAVAIDAHGARLATGNVDGTARVWDLRTLEETHRLYHGNAVYAVAFDPGGVRLATGCSDHTVRVWDLRAETLIEQARARLTRNLTPQEWERYMPGTPYQKFRHDLP
ncbi:trypsin-like peptidase domain-containing protein [Microbispora sp. NPDC046973]|uniref:nSTAND1 domain-containing NTPase n=1 Tax=Microbispora sp. NPDC046973 TaxID=3155022 RepID=UPI0033C5875A